MRMKCPKCSDSNCFSVQVYTWVTMSETLLSEGLKIVTSPLSDSDDVKWHDDSRVRCESCQHETVMSEVVNYSDEVVRRVHAKLNELGIESEFWSVSALLVGGGGPADFSWLAKLVEFGYNDGADSYQSNFFFWKALGVSEKDYDDLVKESQ